MDYEDVVNKSDDDIIAMALQFGDSPIVPYESILTILATTDRVALCERLMSCGLSPDVAPGGADSLELCIQQNGMAKLQMLEVLLKYSGYAISDQHGSGYTLLHIAVSAHDIEVAKFLISRGASMYDMDIDCTRVVAYDMSSRERAELLAYERDHRG